MYNNSFIEAAAMKIHISFIVVVPILLGSNFLFWYTFADSAKILGIHVAFMKKINYDSEKKLVFQFY